MFGSLVVLAGWLCLIGAFVAFCLGLLELSLRLAQVGGSVLAIMLVIHIGSGLVSS